VLALLLTASSFALAEDSPQNERHELMEGVGKAAKVIGAMFRGEAEYDAAAVQESLATFQESAGKFGDLFPEGSETGEGTEAAPAIWEDRDGFNAALQEWADATAAAIAAAPATLEDAKATVGPVFQTCKGCHDNYRIEDE
jgi:cytochrome c556